MRCADSPPAQGRVLLPHSRWKECKSDTGDERRAVQRHLDANVCDAV
jgi:hypothetical protein